MNRERWRDRLDRLKQQRLPGRFSVQAGVTSYSGRGTSKPPTPPRPRFSPWLFLLLLTSSSTLLFLLYWFFYRSKPILPLPSGIARRCIEQQQDIRDVCVIGGGPGGGSAAYYLADGGLDVVLVDKSRFPRDAVCGDRLSPLAQHYLKDMGIMDELIQGQCSRYAVSGGFVSPQGTNFLAKMDNIQGERLLCVQRIILDEKIISACHRAGVTVYDGTEVYNASYNPHTSLWTVSLTNTDLRGHREEIYAKHVVMACGGNHNILGRMNLTGLYRREFYGSRTIILADSHALDEGDHVMFYPKGLLPGFVVLVREVGNFLNMSCVYIADDSMTETKATHLYEDVVLRDPHIMNALGPEAVLLAPKFHPIYVGLKSVPEHLVLVGQAAGLVDPMTGMGIHHALDSGYMAAEKILAQMDEPVEVVVHSYYDALGRKYDRELKLSLFILSTLSTFPLLLEAAVRGIKNKDMVYIESWAMAMMGGRSKLWFLRPMVVMPMFFRSWLLFAQSTYDHLR